MVTQNLKAALIPVLARHFPNALTSELESESLRIALARVLDGKDEFSLERYMATAQDLATLHELECIMQKLGELVGRLHPDTQVSFIKKRYGHNPDAAISSNRTLFLEQFENEVDRMVRDVRAVEEALHSTGPFASHSLGNSRGDTALMVAWVTGVAFDHLAKDHPGIAQSAGSRDAIAPFVKLVTDVFAALKITQNAETTAKKAALAIRKNTHPITGGYSPFQI